MAYTSRHETLYASTERLRRIFVELLKVFAALWDNTSQQVQAQCKLDELKKIQDDLDKDKDPNASQQRRSKDPSGDKGPAEVELSVLSDSYGDMKAGEHFISNNDLDKDDQVVGIVEELR
ncbi:hypothetical protein Hanom_Chr00s104324g01805171 [Helianthus anomalus]